MDILQLKYELAGLKKQREEINLSLKEINKKIESVLISIFEIEMKECGLEIGTNILIPWGKTKRLHKITHIEFDFEPVFVTRMLKSDGSFSDYFSKLQSWNLKKIKIVK